MAEGLGGDKVVMRSHHLPKLTGKRAPIPLVKETVDPGKIKKKS